LVRTSLGKGRNELDWQALPAVLRQRNDATLEEPVTSFGGFLKALPLLEGLG
jgi:hypothetical protein